MKSILIHIRRLISDHRSLEQLQQGRLAEWCRDPLSHPHIQGMSERERADLQFDPEQVKSE